MLLGQRFPLELEDVRRRAEREFFVALDDRATLVLWQKRAGVAFPVMERAIKRMGLPEDLKYVAVIESGLKNRARSWAGAVGPWQFMPATGRENGLRVSKGVDRRRDLEQSTESALKFLSRLHNRFDDWFLALAAYNAGPARVSRSLSKQDVKSYWDVSLPNEAERYVARVAAAKMILSSPERYGVLIPEDERFRPHATSSVEVKTGSAIKVLKLARMARTTYRHIREINPWITSDVLPAGRHSIVVPKSGAQGFATRVAAATPKRAKKKKRGVRHRVREGDTLGLVAAKYGTTVAELTRRNKIRKADMIYPGQLLKVR